MKSGDLSSRDSVLRSTVMDRLSPVSTDSGFESCGCPSSPATSSSAGKFKRLTCVSSLPTSSSCTALIPATDVHSIICDLTPSTSEASLCHEDIVSLDSLSTKSPNAECSPRCDACNSTSSPTVSDFNENISCISSYRYVDGGTVRYHCLWSGCTDIFEKADDLYDHVTELHINVLRELSYVVPKGKQDMEDDEPIRCHWDDCTMFLRRGNQEKKLSWLMDHYRTRHARAANPFHCVIEGCQMRFSTTYRLEEHVRLEHINPPKPVKETPVVLSKESCYGWRPRLYYPVRPRPTMYCPHFDERLLKCVRYMNKHHFKVAFKPVDFLGDLRGAKRRKQRHRYAYDILATDTPSPIKQSQRSEDIADAYSAGGINGTSIFDLFPAMETESTEAKQVKENGAA